MYQGLWKRAGPCWRWTLWECGRGSGMVGGAGVGPGGPRVAASISTRSGPPAHLATLACLLAAHLVQVTGGNRWSSPVSPQSPRLPGTTSGTRSSLALAPQATAVPFPCEQSSRVPLFPGPFISLSARGPASSAPSEGDERRSGTHASLTLGHSRHLSHDSRARSARLVPRCF